ncbi:AAEL010999-PA [Aedes aegypti]|uniref:AAEL010999-PA n=1 Tax=Aedes aegypti TaxID=7159 RepID=Q16RC9_AEDAE|nr:AAEL010999-PA [Aedes aegypti]
MSSKAWQKQSHQSALLMAKWLFGKSKPEQKINPKSTPSVIEGISTGSPTVKDTLVDKAEGVICEPIDRNEPGDEEAEVNPGDMVECRYSDDELTEDELEQESICTGRLRGHRYRKLKAPKRRKVGHVEIILRARNTII